MKLHPDATKSRNDAREGCPTPVRYQRHTFHVLAPDLVGCQVALRVSMKVLLAHHEDTPLKPKYANLFCVLRRRSPDQRHVSFPGRVVNLPGSFCFRGVLEDTHGIP